MSEATCFACGRELPDGEPYSLTEWEAPNFDSGDPIAHWCSIDCLHESIPALGQDDEDSA